MGDNATDDGPLDSTFESPFRGRADFDKRITVCIYEVSVLLLNAGLDRNGNGRRAYLATHPVHGILFCLDAADSLPVSIRGWFGTSGGKVLEMQVTKDDIRTTPAERKRLMRRYTIKKFREQHRFVDRAGND